MLEVSVLAPCLYTGMTLAILKTFGNNSCVYIYCKCKLKYQLLWVPRILVSYHQVPLGHAYQSV